MVQLSTDELVKSALEATGGRLRRQHELVVEFSISALKAQRFEKVLSDACAIVARGVTVGPQVAHLLRQIEDQWVAEGFPDNERIAQLLDAAIADRAPD